MHKLKKTNKSSMSSKYMLLGRQIFNLGPNCETSFYIHHPLYQQSKKFTNSENGHYVDGSFYILTIFTTT